MHLCPGQDGNTAVNQLSVKTVSWKRTTPTNKRSPTNRQAASGSSLHGTSDWLLGSPTAEQPRWPGNFSWTTWLGDWGLSQLFPTFRKLKLIAIWVQEVKNNQTIDSISMAKIISRVFVRQTANGLLFCYRTFSSFRPSSDVLRHI